MARAAEARHCRRVEQPRGPLAWREDVEAITLSAADLETIAQRICSSDRVGTFGIGVLGRNDSFDAWREQMEHCRTHVLAGRFTYDETPQAVRQAKPKRSGPVFDAPVVDVE